MAELLRKLIRNILLLLMVLLLPSAFAATDDKPLAGRTISIMGDSISTYDGWSNKYPITDESCINRYGEPYYGTPDSEFCHNDELLVTDTWWHQAATELGAEILVSNAGNSTGVFCASYPGNADWDLYLKEMLAWKSRPYYMGIDGKSPDIIALYIGSNELARISPSQIGSLAAVNFDALIQKNGNSYTYAVPNTMAEAYCILLHKITVTYPNAEIYCFAVVPSAGGYISTVNSRLAKCPALNGMIKEVAAHYGAIVVDLVEGFNLDPDNDGVATDAAITQFQEYFNNDPHPNALGFDVITETFVKTVKENSRYIVSVETEAGSEEYIQPEMIAADGSFLAGNGAIKGKATDYVTPNGMIVNYESTSSFAGNEEISFDSTYESENSSATYHAIGGENRTYQLNAPAVTLKIPLNAQESDTRISTTDEKEIITGVDPRTTATDGIYDYIITNMKQSGSATVSTLDIVYSENDCDHTFTDLESIASSTFATETNEMIPVSDDNLVKRPTGKEDAPDVPAGYDYSYIGSDQFSRYYAAFAFSNKEFAEAFGGYVNEEPIYTDEENGLELYVGTNHSTFLGARYNLVIPQLFTRYGVDKNSNIARWASVQQYTLADRNGDIITTYCCDQHVNTQKGFGYKAYNVEDADYYDDDDARRIRSIALNGYWGTAEGTGSLAHFKQQLDATGKFSEAELDAVTDGLALTATQYSIWAFANRANSEYVNAYYAKNTGFGYPAVVADQDKVALIFKIRDHLINLPPAVTPRSFTNETIINEKNFITDISISIKSKPAAAVNQDSDDTNDLYAVDLSFTLGVIPAQKTLSDPQDDLVVEIEQNGQIVRKGRIAGPLQEGEVQLIPKDGVYTLSDLPLSEGTQSINFSMTGKQWLDRNTFLYISESKMVDGELTVSQPLVGIASGYHHVNANMALTCDLDVDDDEFCIRHLWRDEIEVPDMPPTSDIGHPILYAAMMAATLTVIPILLFISKRKTAKMDGLE